MLKALIDLKKLGVFAHAVIKKKVLAQVCQGYIMDQHMEDKEIDDTGVMQGQLDGIK